MMKERSSQLKLKAYQKPELIQFGSVKALTTGGTTMASELGGPEMMMMLAMMLMNKMMLRP